MRILKNREKYLYVATSRIGNHRLSTYLLVAFNTDRATCHQEEDARIVGFSVVICQSWFLRVYLTYLVNCWAKLTNLLLGKFMTQSYILVWSVISPKVCCMVEKHYVLLPELRRLVPLMNSYRWPASVVVQEFPSFCLHCSFLLGQSHSKSTIFAITD